MACRKYCPALPSRCGVYNTPDAFSILFTSNSPSSGVPYELPVILLSSDSVSEASHDFYNFARPLAISPLVPVLVSLTFNGTLTGVAGDEVVVTVTAYVTIVNTANGVMTPSAPIPIRATVASGQSVPLCLTYPTTLPPGAYNAFVTFAATETGKTVYVDGALSYSKVPIPPRGCC